MRPCLWLGVAVAIHSAPVGAQQPAKSDGPQARAAGRERTEPVPGVAEAVRANPGAPRVDGILDDDAWSTVEFYSAFVQRDPDEGAAVSERTEFAVVYTNDALFVAVRAHDSRPDQIKALLTRRDEESPSDEITVAIDSYRDRRTGFAFRVNAAGVKRDTYLYDDNNEDDRWDAVWDVDVSVDDHGWVAEFRIPFNQLRFSAADANTFGFNIERRIARLNEVQQWRLLPKDASGVVSLFGDLTGIQGASTVRQPAATDDPFRSGSHARVTGGADIKYGLSSALTLTATINPDFGQVEADPAVVNLSAFETFFPERRPFFNEGLDIFRFRIADGDGDGSEESLFYTRRVGRSPQGEPEDRDGFAESVEQTTILAAGKLSGKTADGWTIGLTGALTDEENAGVVDASGQFFQDPVEPRSGYLVGRLARDFRGGQTKIGAFGTTVQRALPDRLQFLHSQAYAGGLDWSHRFQSNSWAFNGRIVGSHVRGSPEAIARTQRSSARYYQRPDADHLEFDSTRTSLSGVEVAMNFGKTAGNWRWSTGFHSRSPGLEVNDAGYQRDADFTSQFIWLNRRWLQPGKVFRRFNVNFNQWSSWSRGWERRSLGTNLNAHYTLWNYWYGFFGVNRQFKSVTATQLRGGPAIDRPGAWNGWFGFGTDERKTFRGGAAGWFFQQDDNDSWGAGTDVNLSWRPMSNMDVSASPGLNWNRDTWQYLETETVNETDEYIFGELRQTTASMTLRANMTFSPALSLQVYTEPFVSAGHYVGFKRVVEPRADTFLGQFEDFSQEWVIDLDGDVGLDVDRDGSPDVELSNPDFTFLSFRSNVVLRWEYSLGSTIFFVWQHGRTGSGNDGRFDFRSDVSDLFSADAENVLLFKVNYWLSP